jgi:hypothetical protein
MRDLIAFTLGLAVSAAWRACRERPTNRDGKSGRHPDSHWETNPRIVGAGYQPAGSGRRPAEPPHEGSSGKR